MARKLKPAKREDVEDLTIAIALVREARKLFRKHGCRSTAQRLNKALDSADGAVRHMCHRINHGYRERHKFFEELADRI